MWNVQLPVSYTHLVFALYLLAKKEAVAAHLKKLIETVLPQKTAQRLLSICLLYTSSQRM